MKSVAFHWSKGEKLTEQEIKTNMDKALQKKDYFMLALVLYKVSKYKNLMYAESSIKVKYRECFLGFREAFHEKLYFKLHPQSDFI